MTEDNADFARIFERNKVWSDRLKRINPDYFERLSQQQAPDFLWIGCSDSRVPANEIMDLLPGEVFVHRNIANVVVPSDLNFLSVLQYAVEVLKIRQIIVCGHYGCGGVRASLIDENHGLIDNWLNHIREVHRLHRDRFTDDMSIDEQADLLCELNVLEQVNHVCNTTIVKDAWSRGVPVVVHGVIYNLKDGILNALCDKQTEQCYHKLLTLHVDS